MEQRNWDKLGIKTSLLGFGCMRFPLNSDGKINKELTTKMLDLAFENGVNYFDNAYMYLNYQDEIFMGEYLSTKDRGSFYVTSKMPMMMVNSLTEAKEIFSKQLSNLKIDHFDFYLLHALNKDTWKKSIDLKILDYLLEEKKNGRIKYLGFSFHDEFNVFKDIIDYREWDFAQIQYNYVDQNIQAGNKGYEYAKEHQVPLVIMEPVKGGNLCNLPSDISKIFSDYDHRTKSLASYGYRFVGSLDNVKVILSGMSSLEQVMDNLNTFKNFEPLSIKETALVEEVRIALEKRTFNGCTGCRYCMPCPHGVDIPRNFRTYNNFARFNDSEDFNYYYSTMKEKNSSADSCKKCHACEVKCPQHIKIASELANVKELANKISK